MNTPNTSPRRAPALAVGALVIAGLGALGGGTLVERFRPTLPEVERIAMPVGVNAPMWVRAWLVPRTLPDGYELRPPEVVEVPALVRENFDDANLAARGWYDGHVDVEQGSGAFHFSSGMSEPDSGGAIRIAFPPAPAVTIRFRLRLSANWVGSGQTAHPHLIYLTTNLDARDVGPARTRTTAYIEPSGLRVAALLQDGTNIDATRIRQDVAGESRAVNGCNSLPAPGVDCYRRGDGQWMNGRRWASPVDVFRPGEWATVEATFRMNSVVAGVGLPNGSISVQVDGVRVVHATGLVVRTGRHPGMLWQYLLIGPWMNASPVEQTLWLDDLLVTGASE